MWKKNRENNSNKKSGGGVPFFNVFSRKKIASLMMAGVMIATPIMLAGCSDGKDGANGADGTMWYTGTEQPKESQGKIGDFFYDKATSTIYIKTENGWESQGSIKGEQGDKGDTGSAGATWLNGTVDPTEDQGKDGDFYLNTSSWDLFAKIKGCWTRQGNIKGEKGDTGSQGEKGEKGEDGTSVYVGYDGYIWSGKIRTEYKAQIDETDRTDIWEDTLGVSNTMKEYFAYEYVDLSSNVIALMQYYKPNAQMTIYGNTKITEIQVVCENAGTLYIGKANVSDIVNARTSGATLSATTNPYGVNAGLNTITFDTPLELAEGETLVLGGSGSTANLFVAKGIPLDDEVGNFTLVNGKANTNIISETGEYADTLAIKVKAKAVEEIEARVFENFETDFSSSLVNKQVVTTSCPFKYQTSYDSNFSGKTITKIGAYCSANNASSGKQPYMTIYKIKTSTTKNFDTNAIATIQIYFPADSTKDQLFYADCNITLAEDETIAFGKSDDTFVWKFRGDMNGAGNVLGNDGNESPAASLAFDIYVKKIVEIDSSTHLANLNTKEEEAITQAKINTLKTALRGKNLSILGDSISTFDGYSNDSTNTNSTIGNNATYYTGSNCGITSVDQTWWKQTADKTGMSVLVNNSYSGSKVTDTGDTSIKALTRAQNLHDDTGDNKGTNPDIIAVYMGINDFIGGVSSTDFETAYDKMIAQIRTTYGKDVKIFVFTLVTYGTTGDNNETLLAYNEAIKTIATKYSCVVVDYANSGVNSSNLSTYMQDASLLHPNAQGMDVISDCFWNALYETYVTNATQTQK